MNKASKSQKSIVKPKAGSGSMSKADNSGRWEWLWNHFELPALLIAFPFCLLCLAEFQKNHKWLIIICCVISAILIGLSFVNGRGRERLNQPVLAVALYYLIVAISVCWSCAGKFFLREYSKLLYVLPLFLFVAFYLHKSRRAVRNLLLLICGASAILSILGVDVASAGISVPFLSRISYTNPEEWKNWTSFRIPGIFANANISGGVSAIGIMLTLGLYMTEKKSGGKNGWWAALLGSLQVFSFVSGLNRSATVFLAVSIVVAFFICREYRNAVFLYCVFVFVPAVCLAFAAARYYPTIYVTITGIKVYFPLIFMAAAAGISVLLIQICAAHAEKLIGRHKKTCRVLLFLLVGIALCGGVLSLTVHQPLHITGGHPVVRACYPVPGSYSMRIEASGNVNVLVYSQTTEQVATDTWSELYDGDATAAAFEVPEQSRIVSFRFYADADVDVLNAAIENEAQPYEIHLGYFLLPEALANRLVGIRATKNIVERFQFFRDGMKIFKDYPVFGAGLGAFESLIAGYQEFRYVTRYVHNHYIQVLVDSGIVGLASYLFILVSCFLCILQGRNENDPFHELFAPVMGAFVMLVLNSIMDVVMSTTAYLPFAYSLFGICALCWGKPLTKKWLAAVGQIGFGAVSLTYAVLISLNVRANNVALKSSNNPVRFFNTLESAIRMDAFEYVDWKMSYLSASAQLQAPEYKASADRYAEELLKVPSNSLHTYLVSYYLAYRNYDMALQAAQNGAHFNYADADTWNHYFADFQNSAVTNPEDSEEIYRITLALSDSFETEIARMFKPISLNKASRTWIETAKNSIHE